MLSCRSSSGSIESVTYREAVGHLLLPVHRFDEHKVADYPCWGQAEDRGVVIQGNPNHGVFRLPTERYIKKKRNTLPRWHERFIISSQAAAMGPRTPIKQCIKICPRVERVMCRQVPHQSSAYSGVRTGDRSNVFLT